MAHSHKPIIWGLFAAGGTIAAFVIPMLVLITCLAVPLGLLPRELLSFANVQQLLQHPAIHFLALAVLNVVIWHAAHRLRITAHDLGIRNDAATMLVCYGFAAFGTVLSLVALLGR